MNEVTGLEMGQLWRLKKYYVRIIELGKNTVLFKMADSVDATPERTLASDIDTLWRYLRSRKGRLIAAEKA